MVQIKMSLCLHFSRSHTSYYITKQLNHMVRVAYGVGSYRLLFIRSWRQCETVLRQCETVLRRGETHFKFFHVLRFPMYFPEQSTTSCLPDAPVRHLPAAVINYSLLESSTVSRHLRTSPWAAPNTWTTSRISAHLSTRTTLLQLKDGQLK